MDFIKKIKSKIDREIKPEKIELINNSHLHQKHKSFDINKVHLKLIINSKVLKQMKRTEAHKIIFALLKDEMKNKIHALEIEIK